jgi:hypothetical protein
VSVSRGSLETEVLARLESSNGALRRVVTERGYNRYDGGRSCALRNVGRKHSCKEMAYSAEGQEESSDCYVHSVKPRSNEENRAVNVFASGELNTVFVLVSLAKQESDTK